MASSWTLAKNTQDSVAEKEAKGAATENGKKLDEVEEVSVFAKQRSSKPSLRLSIFRKKNNSAAQKSTPDGTTAPSKDTVDVTSGSQKPVVGGLSGKASARRTSSLGVDGTRSSSPVQKKITPTLSGGGLPLKAKFRYSFRQPKQSKKLLNQNSHSLIPATPSVVLTEETLPNEEGTGDSSNNKEAQESSTMSKKSSFEEQLLSAVQPSSLPTRCMFYYHCKTFDRNISFQNNFRTYIF